MAVRVLIVDDSASFRWWARKLLASGGMEVIGEEATGRGALATAVLLRPDVVLLDIGLPDLDGFTVCRRLHDANLRVVLCSVRARPNFGDRIAQCGASGFLAKERISAAALMALLLDR